MGNSAVQLYSTSSPCGVAKALATHPGVRALRVSDFVSYDSKPRSVLAAPRRKSTRTRSKLDTMNRTRWQSQHPQQAPNRAIFWNVAIAFRVRVKIARKRASNLSGYRSVWPTARREDLPRLGFGFPGLFFLALRARHSWLELSALRLEIAFASR